MCLKVAAVDTHVPVAYFEFGGRGDPDRPLSLLSFPRVVGRRAPRPARSGATLTTSWADRQRRSMTPDPTHHALPGGPVVASAAG